MQRLIAFAGDAVQYAATRAPAAANRLLASPYSKVARADARLPGATAQFERALEEIALAYRAQGADLGVVLRTVRLAFALDADASPAELAGLEALEAAARRFDESRAPGAEWSPLDAQRAIRELARPTPAGARAVPAPQPLARREPEAPRSVKRRRSHFSASSLGMYAGCERKWYYRYVCSAVEDKGSSASFYGSAFHWALEKFHQDYSRGDGAPAAELAARLDGWISTAFERFRSRFETNVEYELLTRRARRTARRYIDWFVARAKRQPFEVVGTESSAELELDGYGFIGFIDRLDRDDATGSLAVLDYKTGSIAESAEQYRKSVAAFTDFQLPFYYWACSARGERVTRLALIPLKDPLLEVEPIELEVVPISAPAGRRDATVGTIGIDELERARAKMIELARRLADEPIERFAVTSDPDECRYCSYRNSCRRRPLRREDRFAH